MSMWLLIYLRGKPITLERQLISDGKTMNILGSIEIDWRGGATVGLKWRETGVIW
jgi:hypothetical protein